jgi:hypothetical protein
MFGWLFFLIKDKNGDIVITSSYKIIVGAENF